jgi:5-methylcytosine-specific restriction endonuclease McrA
MSNYKKLLHTCGQAGCNVVIAGDKRYCEKHQAQHEAAWQAKKQQYRKSKLAKAINAQNQKHYDAAQRDKEASAFYHSRQWRQVRNYVYSRDGAQCQACHKPATVDLLIVDHRHPLKYSPAEKLDTSNLWTLCYQCHSRKTKIEQKIAEQPHGAEKLRHLDKEWWQRTLEEEQGQTITMKEWRKWHDNK